MKLDLIIALIICLCLHRNSLSINIDNDQKSNNNTSEALDNHNHLLHHTVNDSVDSDGSNGGNDRHHDRDTIDDSIDTKNHHHHGTKQTKNDILDLDQTTIKMLANTAIIRMLEEHGDFDFDELNVSKQQELLNYVRQ